MSHFEIELKNYIRFEILLTTICENECLILTQNSSLHFFKISLIEKRYKLI